MKNLITKSISLLLIIVIAFMMANCNNIFSRVPSNWTNPSLSDPSEKIETEIIDKEDAINEYITAEIYLKEITEAEDKIEELLLGESIINEVILCKTIYVPQENIEEFAENSQTKELFGSGINFDALTTKIAVGTGIIVTLVVLTKIGFYEPIANVVFSAASESMKFAVTGAALGSLYGGLIGATDEIDDTRRTSAVLSIAAATVGVIISVVSLISAIPSGGVSSIGIAEGIKITIAAVSVLAAIVGTTVSTVNAVKTFKSTDAKDIDWSNIDWKKVGVSAAEQAINSSADGYMWGAITGTVYGGAEGYANYHKYGTSYSTLETRIKHVPTENSSRGRWSGSRGDSDFVLNEPLTLTDGTVVSKITYKNAVPDFSPFAKAEVKIISMTDTRYGSNGNFAKADEALAKIWNKSKYNGKTWSARDIANYRESNTLTWHEMSNMDYMQLVPTEVNATFSHMGGCSEYRIMIGQSGGSEFD